MKQLKRFRREIVWALLIAVAIGTLWGGYRVSGLYAKKISWDDLQQLNYQTGEVPSALKNLDGEIVRLPGFMVPLEGDMENITEFLFFPAAGYCIHVPPPPPNMTVYVTSEQGVSPEMLLKGALWLTGKLQIINVNTTMAKAGYSMQALEVEPYHFFM